MSIVEEEASLPLYALKDNDRKHVWHSFAPLAGEAWMVNHAKEEYVTDIDGQRYLDAMSGLWCVNAGYGQERIAKKVYEQMVQLSYYPMTAAHIPGAKLAKKLNEWLGAPYRIFYGNSGSEANEAAFKIARQYHFLKGNPTKYKIISRYRAYHGSTMGALSATGQQQRKYGFEPMVPGFLHVHPPDPYRDFAEDHLDEYGERLARDLERTILWEGSETIAAMIMEPFITGGGILIPPPNYLPLVAEICRKHDILLIIDEVINGFGRTGKNFGFQHSLVTPDMVTMAKGITSAYLPLSAVAVRPEIYEVFEAADGEYARFRHVNTFGGHPVSCAAALENLAIFEEWNLVHRSKTMGAILLEGLNDLKTLPIVGDVRGIGLLAGIELVIDRNTREPLPAAQVAAIVGSCKTAGVIIGKNGDTVAGLNNVITVAPPLTVSEEQIATIVDVLRSAIAANLLS